MFRLFVLATLCLSFAVTACGGGGKKRATIRKGDKGEAGKESEKTRALNKAIEDKKCLRLDRLFSEIVKLKDETVVIYTSDLHLGNVAGGGAGAQPTFEPQVDDKVRAAAFLAPQAKPEPILQSLRASEIQTSAHKAWLMSVSAIDQDCKVAAFENTGMKATYDIIKSGRTALWLKNKDGSEFLFYQYDRKNKITITQYTSNTEKFCGKDARFIKRQYMVGLDESADNIQLDRSFAQLIADNMDEPVALTAALGKDANGRVSSGKVIIKFSVMKAIQEILHEGRFTKPVCPAP